MLSQVSVRRFIRAGDRPDIIETGEEATKLLSFDSSDAGPEPGCESMVVAKESSEQELVEQPG
jgi:hypothetical protein